MKTYPFFLFAILCLTFSSCRKDLLHWQSVTQIAVDSNAQLNTAVWLPSGIGIVGGGGRFETARVLISTDKGKTWQWKQMPNDSKGFFGSCLAPDGTVYFSSMYLRLCSSSDALSSYKYSPLTYKEEFMGAISFGEKDKGVGVTALGIDSGGVVLFDAQHNFISFSRFPFSLWDIKMFDAQSGIAVGSGVVMKTKDGGKTWMRLSVIGDNFNSIAALDSNRIFVSGLSGFIVKTSDGGATWKRLRNGSNITLPRYQLWDLLFLNEQKGYAVGEKGVVIYTDDGGEHWMEFDRFTTHNLRFISLCPDGQLLTGGENGTLYRLAVK